MIGTIASATAKEVIGTILKTIGIGALGGASFYGGLKGAKVIDKTIQRKRAEKAAAAEGAYDDEPINGEGPVEGNTEETTEAPVEETTTEEIVEETEEEA